MDLGDRSSPYAPRVREDLTGMYGIKWYHVNTQNEAEALGAAGLPRRGDGWPDSDLPLLRCVGRDSVYHAGYNDPSTPGLGGRCHVRCDYRWLYDGTPYPGPGAAYTEVGTRTSTALSKQDVRLVAPPLPGEPAPPPPSGDALLPINGGAGTPTMVGGSLYRVTIFPVNQRYSNGELELLQRRYAVNADVVHLPPIKGGNASDLMIFAPGLLQYADFKVSKENGYLKIEHVVIVGDTHLDVYYWRTVNQNGTYAATRRVESTVYYRRKMAAIFRA